MSRRASALTLAAAALLRSPSPSTSRSAPPRAEQSGGAGVVVSLDGSISPRHIPRHRPVPVSLTLAGAVRGSDGSPPPQLGRIEIAFGARGGLDTAGLPRLPARPPAQRHLAPGPRPLPRGPRRPRHDHHRSPAQSQRADRAPAPASSPSTDARTAAPQSGSMRYSASPGRLLRPSLLPAPPAHRRLRRPHALAGPSRPRPLAAPALLRDHPRAPLPHAGRAPQLPERPLPAAASLQHRHPSPRPGHLPLHAPADPDHDDPSAAAGCADERAAIRPHPRLPRALALE